MVAFFVAQAAFRRLLHPLKLPPRQRAAEFLGKGNDGWVRRAPQGVLTIVHSARVPMRAI
jgi:hypothetical protein